MVVKPRYLKTAVERKVEQAILRAYERDWRPRLFRYLQSCPGTWHGVGRFAQIVEGAGDGDWLGVILSYAQADAGLLIFGRAQAFVS